MATQLTYNGYYIGDAINTPLITFELTVTEETYKNLLKYNIHGESILTIENISFVVQHVGLVSQQKGLSGSINLIELKGFLL